MHIVMKSIWIQWLESKLPSAGYIVSEVVYKLTDLAGMLIEYDVRVFSVLDIKCTYGETVPKFNVCDTQLCKSVEAPPLALMSIAPELEGSKNFINYGVTEQLALDLRKKFKQQKNFETRDQRSCRRFPKVEDLLNICSSKDS